MPEALKCPSCSAPLDYPPAGGATMRCPYCNTIVMAPGDSRSSLHAGDFPPGLGPLISKAMDMSQVADLLRQGKKIQAIKIIRETHNVDLTAAKAAIDHLAAQSSLGGPVRNNYSTVTVSTRGFRLGPFLAIFGVVIGFVAIMIVRAIHTATVVTSSPPVTSFTMGIPDLSSLAPAKPTFAHMAMEFGSEGIGAGQFKDSRSVAIDGAGHIYVGEYSDGRVQVFDPQGKFLAEWSVGAKKSLMNLTADMHGNVYAVIPFQIFRYDGLTGTPQGELENNNGDTQENYMDAYAALNGNVYAIGNSSNIVILGPDGKIKSVIDAAQKVGEDVSFDKIVALPTGEIYALDRQRGIFKFAADGRYINRFGNVDESPNGGPGHLFSANNLAFDGKGRIYVSNADPAVQVFDAGGSYLDSIEPNDVCFGLAVNNQNELFACFRNEHAIRKYVLDKP